MRILVIQTAFAGDLILATPMIEELARSRPDAEIDVLCIPSTAGLLANNPHIRTLIVYQKRAGVRETRRVLREIRRNWYTHCIVPHRSFRSAMLARRSGARVRITFDASTASFLSTVQVPYQPGSHEAERNLSLLTALEIQYNPRAQARLYPSSSDYEMVRTLLASHQAESYACIAPGSVWATKRWTEEGFTETARALASGMHVFLTGGAGDADLCSRIEAAVGTPRVISVAGRMSWLETAALIGGSRVVISNDSAPVHVAAAMQTPVVEIYGATTPDFGFSPWQTPHRIVQRMGLSCRPCGIHGGNTCPIRTFVCMNELPASEVIEAARELIEKG